MVVANKQLWRFKLENSKFIGHEVDNCDTNRNLICTICTNSNMARYDWCSVKAEFLYKRTLF